MEAIGFSASMRLGELVVVIDGNGLQGFGTTAEVSRGRDVQRLLASFDIELSRVDGHKLEGIREVLLKPSSSKPLFLWLDTVKGHGIVEIEGKLSSHYWPLTIDQFHQRREW
jgi:transketolase